MGYTAIIDYGAGNLMSVYNAMKYIGAECKVTEELDEIRAADALILPGVGAFPKAVRALDMLGITWVLKEEALKKPLLGICLGMQLLFSQSEEIERTKGFSFIPGAVKKLGTDLKLPQIGWNSLQFRNHNALTRGLSDGCYVYFVHSYQGLAEHPEDVTAVTEYGCEVTAMVSRKNIYGCQFHPEKSAEPGLVILENFKELTK